MKKLLLLSTAALLSVASSYGAKDPATYDVMNGIKCENIWLNSRGIDKAAYEASVPGKTFAKYRTAAIYNNVVYIGSSLADNDAIVDEKGNKVDVAGVDMYNASTGEYIGKIHATIDGTPIQGLLCANQVGVDSFGNLWIAPYVASNKNGYKVYSVDKTTGAAKLQAELPMTEDGRIDYCDVIGDITRTQANCTVMAAAAPPASTAVVYRWVAAKGGNWEGGFDGDDSLVFTALYPANQTAWSYAPVAKIVLGEGEEAYNGDLFYIDGFTTAPTLYNTGSTISDSFENAPDLTPASLGANGVAEFHINGKNFITYPNNQHTGDNGGNEIFVCEMGPNMAFAGMAKYWQLPAAGLNPELTSDGGTRVHSLFPEYVKDANGKEGVLLLNFKCNAGFGVYLIADKDYQMAGVEENLAGNAAKVTVNGGMINISEEASEIAVYNVAGQLVAKVNNATSVEAPATAGAYIVKATVNGTPIVKKVVL